MFKHILLATDGSEASAHAAALAVGLARTHGAKLTALYVADPYPYLGVGEVNPMATKPMPQRGSNSGPKRTRRWRLCARPAARP